jgi:Protein of unknown function (DUF2550)
MWILIWTGIGILAVLGMVAVVFVRRQFIARGGGTIESSLRLFGADEFRWYRMFSLAFGPRRVLVRRGLAVESRRVPDGPERLVLPDDWVILRCRSQQENVEIAMAESTATGFLSWLESAPPGTANPKSRRSRTT